MTKYYLYVYVRPDTGLIFYVGKGKGRRASIVKWRNKYFTRVVEKLRCEGMQPTYHILRTGLTENEAHSHEIVLIGQLKAQGIPLTNLTNGGEGTSGRVVSEISRAKCRASNTGRVLTKEHREKLSAAKRGKPSSRKGCVVSVDQRVKISATLTGRKLSDEHRAKLLGRSGGMEGKRHTAETRFKISETKLARLAEKGRETWLTTVE